MNIILLSPLPPPNGGIATWTEIYKKNMLDMGHVIDVVDLAVKGIRSRDIHGKIHFKDELRRNANIYHELSCYLRDRSYDVAHVNTSCSNLGIIRDYHCIKKIEKKGIPIVLECHCNLVDALHNRMKNKFFRLMASKVKEIIVLNDASLNKAKKIAPGKVIKLPNFIEKERIIHEKQISDRIHRVLFTGNILKTKGCNEIIESAKKMQQIDFYLVGKNGNEIELKEVPGNVFLEGPRNRDEVKKYLEGADVFLFPSYSEGFSMSLLEAMACGLPIIATDVGENREMVGSGGGTIIPPRDSEKIIESLIGMNDKAVRQSMSINNTKKVRGQYAADVVLAKIVKIYDSVIC